MTPRCDAPLSDDDLLDYWIHAIDGEDANRIEEHIFACGACAARFEGLASLGVGLSELVRRGRIAGIVSRTLLNRMQRDGVHVRQYVLSPGDRVPCAAFPDDDLVVVAMRADFTGSDAVSVSLTDEDGSLVDQVNDIPVASKDVELLWATPGAIIRRLTTARRRLTLRSATHESRILAEYELDHTSLSA
jgi:hypothetical protein